MNRISPRRSRNLPLPRFPRQKPQASRNLGRVEELSGQGDHAVHQTSFDQILPNLALARLGGRHRAVGEHESGRAPRRQMVDHVLHPGEVGVTLGRDAVLPALVVGKTIAAPVGDIERRIGEDEVCPEVGVTVIVEAIAMGDPAFDAADGQIHLG